MTTHAGAESTPTTRPVAGEVHAPPPSAQPTEIQPTAGQPATPLRATPPAITALTGIRALAAVWVVADHFQVQLFSLFPLLRALTPPIQAGYLSVEIFFILSGFILAYNYGERTKTGVAYRKFLWARVARIYPVHLTTLFIILVIAMSAPKAFMDDIGRDFPNNPANFVANIFMLQSLPGFRAFDAPSWSLSCEFAGYLLFPVLAWWALRMSGRAALLWAAVITSAGMVAVLTTAGGAENWSVSYHAMWLRVGTEFTVGVLLWAWWRDRDRGSALWDLAAVLSLAVVFTVSYLVAPGSVGTFVVLPVIAVFVIACASATGPFARFFSTPLLQWGGKLTFSLYLAHVPAKLIVLLMLPWEDYVDAPLVVRIGWLMVMLAWTLGLTAGLYYLIEEPARKRMLTWYARRGTARDTARDTAARSTA